MQLRPDRVDVHDLSVDVGRIDGVLIVRPHHGAARVTFLDHELMA